MGYLSRRLDTPENLRPWRQAGVRGLLIGRPGPAAAAQPPGAQPAPPSTRPRLAKPRQSPSPVEPRSPSKPLSPPQPPPDHPAPTQWPPVWRGYLDKAPRGCCVAFTYYDLCLDLGGRSEKWRGDLWRSILRGLAWPQGTVAFWPMSAPDDQMIVRADGPMFLAGTAALGISQVACFGVDALTALTSEISAPYASLSLHGLRVHLLPSPREIAAHDAELNKVLAFLGRLRVNTPTS